MSTLRKLIVLCLATIGLTYASLLVPGHATVVCSRVNVPIYCPVLAYGFPLPFLADSQGISPIGSVSRDPLSLLIREDELLWPQLWLSMGFWLLLAVAGGVAWKRLWRDSRR